MGVGVSTAAARQVQEKEEEKKKAEEEAKKQGQSNSTGKNKIDVPDDKTNVGKAHPVQGPLMDGKTGKITIELNGDGYLTITMDEVWTQYLAPLNLSLEIKPDDNILSEASINATLQETSVSIKISVFLQVLLNIASITVLNWEKCENSNRYKSLSICKFLSLLQNNSVDMSILSKVIVSFLAFMEVYANVPAYKDLVQSMSLDIQKSSTIFKVNLRQFETAIAQRFKSAAQLHGQDVKKYSTELMAALSEISKKNPDFYESLVGLFIRDIIELMMDFRNMTIVQQGGAKGKKKHAQKKKFIAGRWRNVIRDKKTRKEMVMLKGKLTFVSDIAKITK